MAYVSGSSFRSLNRGRSRYYTAAVPTPSDAPSHAKDSFWKPLGQQYLADVDKKIKDGLIGVPLYQELELELEHLVQITKDLRQRRDRCIPLCSYIHRLPTEVISHIFSLNASVDPPRATHHVENRRDKLITSSVTYYDLGWVTVTHVCARWREIALNTPVLWADSVCKLPHIRQLMLKRAGSASLHLEVYPTESPKKGMDLALVKFAIKNLSRSRRVSASFAPGSNHYRKVLVGISQTSMPHLESLVFNGDGGLTQADISALSAPRLSSCTFTGVYPGWDPTSITHLDFTRKFTFQLPLFAQFFDLLKASKKLQWLRMSGSIPMPPDEYSKTIVPLPFLKYLSITDAPDRCIAFLNHVSPSPLARTFLSLRGPAETTDIATILALLGTTLHFDDASETHRAIALSFKISKLGHLHIRTFASTQSNNVDKDHDVEVFRKGYKLAHELTWEGWIAKAEVTFIAVGAEILHTYGLANIKELALEVPGHYTLDTCSRTFSLFPHIQTLYLSSPKSIEGVLDALISTSNNDHGTPLLKALQHLRIDTLELMPDVTSEEQNTLSSEVYQLLYMLRKRQDLGFGLKTMEIKHIRYGKRDSSMQEFMEVVQGLEKEITGTGLTCEVIYPGNGLRRT